MQIGRIEGATRELGRGQGYLGLPVRDVILNCSVGGEGTPAMETAWIPTPAELDALNKGASIILRILGTGHPPVMLEVGRPPDEQERPPAPPNTTSCKGSPR